MRGRLVRALVMGLALTFVLLPLEGAGGNELHPGADGSSTAGGWQQQPPTPPPGLPPKPKHPKLDSHLNELIDLLATLPEDEVARRGAISQGSSVAVYIWLEPDAAPGIERALLSRGGIVANTFENTIEAYVPVRSLAALDAIPGILSVQSIIPPRPTVASQGAVVHNSANWNTNGYVGAGIKVGIIDVGFAGYSSLIGSELPAPAGKRCYTAVGVVTTNMADCESGGEKHGTAVAETIIDVAPGAVLYISDPISSGDLITTAQWMVAQGVKVINHSVGWPWWGSAGDGTSVFSDSPLVAVNQATGAGLIWVNAAGNEAESTWTGPYAEGMVDGWHEFAGEDANDVLHGLQAGEQIVVEMRWDDSWGNATKDVDLVLFNGIWEPVAWSTYIQDGSPGSYPYEMLVYTAPSYGNYHIRVGRYSLEVPSRLQVHVATGQPLRRSVAAGSIGVPADSRSSGMISVGASPWEYTSNLESFSSRGPTADGRIKPELVGADRGATVSYGEEFPGTSQAAPHVAGLAALVRARFPSYTLADTVAYLKGWAQDRGATGPDHSWGWGFASLPPLGGTKLAWVAVPDTVKTIAPFDVQPVVAVQNAAGQTVTTLPPTEVTLSQISGGNTLSCDGGNVATTVNGVATFAGCSIGEPGWFRLRATAWGLTQVESEDILAEMLSFYVEKLSPAYASVGGPSFQLTVDGSYFVEGSIVRWNGADRPTVFVSNTRLVATIPAEDITEVTPANVTVYVPLLGGQVTWQHTFWILNPPVTIPGVSKN